MDAQKIEDFITDMAVRNNDFAIAYAILVLARNVSTLGEITENTLDRIAAALEDTGEA